MKTKLGDLIEEYSERNVDNKYKPVAVGKYGIRARESIYTKELAKDYSKNKLIYKGTLTVGMGSNQIDIGILRDDEIYSVSPAYHTYKIKIPNYDYLDYLLAANNNRMFSIYANRGSRQGKTLDLKRWLTDELCLHDEKDQKIIVHTLNTVKQLINQKEAELVELDNLIKARFVEMFGDRFLNTMNWPTKKLGECATFRNGKAHEKVISETGQYVLITSRAIASDLQDVRRTDSLLTPLATGDIVMVMSDVPNGKALAKCLLITENEKYTLNQRICSLSNYDLNPVFFTYLLNRHQFFLSFNDGNGQTNLRKDDILNCPLIRPSIELQNQFANFVAQVDKSKFTLSNKLAMCNFYVRLVYDRIMHGRIDL